MKIAVFSFKDQDVSSSLTDLVMKYKDKNPTLLLPIIKKNEKFTKSVLDVALATDVKVTCFFDSAVGLDQVLKQADDINLTENPVKEVIRHLSPGDTMGIVWDDTPNAHVVLHTVEDLALDTWDLSGELEELEAEEFSFSLSEDDIHDEMMATMGKFVDLMCAFVANLVMNSLSEAVAEHIMLSEEDKDKKDIDPFEDLG